MKRPLTDSPCGGHLNLQSTQSSEQNISVIIILRNPITFNCSHKVQLKYLYQDNSVDNNYTFKYATFVT